MFEPEEKVWIRKILAFQGDEIAITKAYGAMYKLHKPLLL
jgi:hypothetical protein